MSENNGWRRMLQEGGWWDNPPTERARTRGLTRREFLKHTGLGLLALGGAGTLLSSCGGSPAGEAPPVKTGYLPITDAAPLLVGHAGDHFKEQNLEVTEPTLFRGWSSLSEAFLSEKVNVAHFLMPMTVWMRYNLEAPVKVVAWDHVDGSALTVSQEIDRWDQLGGRNVAVPYWYSIHNVVVQMGLREHGLRPQSEDPSRTIPPDRTNLVVMPPPDMPAALSNGSIDGYIVAEPFNAIGEIEAGGKILRFTGDIWKRHACCVVVMHEKHLNDHPDWARSVLRGILNAQVWIRNHRRQAARLLSKQESGLLPYESKAIDRAMNYYDAAQYGSAIRNPDWNSRRIDFYPYPYPSYTKALVDHLKTTHVEGEATFLNDLNTDDVAEDLVAYEPVKDALEAAGGPSAFGVSEDRGYSRTETIDV